MCTSGRLPRVPARTVPLLLVAWLVAAAPASRAADPAAPIQQSLLTGTVTGASGRPVAGARVYVNSCRGGAPADATELLEGARTDERGRYRLTVRFRGDSLIVEETRCEADGYIRSVSRQRVGLQPGRVHDGPDFRLERGQVLAGRVTWPVTTFEATAGIRPEDRRFTLRVEGPSFDALYHTARGGRFEIFVPPGTYTLTLMLGSDRPELKGVRAPARDLHIRPSSGAVFTEDFGLAFDALWKNMDEHYAYFFLKDVDWDALGESHRGRAGAAGRDDEFVSLLTEMLARLEDPNVRIERQGEQIATFSRTVRRNWNLRAVRAELAEATDCGEFATVGRTRGDGFGYLLIRDQGAAEVASVREALEAMVALRETPGFVVDLRPGASGGDERLARPIGEFFCPEQTVYAMSKYRAPEARDAFGVTALRKLRAAKTPYTRPVVCLIGGRCAGAGEALVLMFQALPHATTIGLPTRGAGGEPQPFEVPGTRLRVWYPHWAALNARGEPFEGVGIAPDVTVDAPPEAYDPEEQPAGEPDETPPGRDPTLEKALELLRRRVAEAPSNRSATP